MIQKLFDFFLQRSAKKLDGYKTTIGGIGMILTGIIGLAGHYFQDQGLPNMEIDTALTTITGGFAVLGIGGKIEKSMVVQKNLANKLGHPVGTLDQ